RSIRYKPKWAGFRSRDVIVPLFIVSIVALAAAALGRYKKSQTEYVWDGSADLSVSIEPADRRPCRLRALTLPREEYLEELQGAPENRGYHGERFVDIPEFDGKPFRVMIDTSGRCTGLGREIWYAQYRCLVVWIDRPGEPQKRFVFTIPDV